MKLLWLDTETSGLDPKRHCIVQMGAMLEHNGDTLTTLDTLVAPPTWRDVDDVALGISGITREQLNDAPNVTSAHALLCMRLGHHIDKFNPRDKAFIAGYNASFDRDMLYNLFQDARDSFFGSWFHYHILDLYAVTQALVALGVLPTPDKKTPGAPLRDLKLTSVCAFLKIPLPKAHTAIADINATRSLCTLYQENEWLPKFTQ